MRQILFSSYFKFKNIFVCFILISRISPKVLENIPKSEYRLFVGFCVWGKAQLQNEIENQHDWVIVKNPISSLFSVWLINFFLFRFVIKT